MDKTYSPTEIEPRVYARWEAAGYFQPAASPRSGAPSYCIVIPPPNVTGTLHMGHAFQDTIMDALTRVHRMRGESTLWQPGTDHAGIATQMVVERQLEARGLRRADLGREGFVQETWRWKEQSGGIMAAQMRRLGVSVDWTRDRFTMDPGLTRAVIEVFVELHRQGLIYRGKRLVNWDPVLLTALSDLEVQSSEAALAKAEATSLQTEQQARRISYLAKQHAASEAENDRAVAAEGQARADVEGAKAALARAASLRSPQ